MIFFNNKSSKTRSCDVKIKPHGWQTRNIPNSVINTWTQSLVITLNLCHEFTPKKMESKREGRDSSLC